MIYCVLGIPFIIQRILFEEKQIPLVTKPYTLKLVCHSPINHFWIFFNHLIFLGEHYTEECHKQWLALEVISELVSQVQIQYILF